MDKAIKFLDILNGKISAFNNSLTNGEKLTLNIARTIRDAIWMAIGLITYHYLWA